MKVISGCKSKINRHCNGKKNRANILPISHKIALGKQSKDWATHPTLEPWCEHMCSGKVDTSCFTIGTRRVTVKRGEYNLIWKSFNYGHMYMYYRKLWTHVHVHVLYNVYAVIVYYLYDYKYGI